MISKMGFFFQLHFGFSFYKESEFDLASLAHGLCQLEIVGFRQQIFLVPLSKSLHGITSGEGYLSSSKMVAFSLCSFMM